MSSVAWLVNKRKRGTKKRHAKASRRRSPAASSAPAKHRKRRGKRRSGGVMNFLKSKRGKSRKHNPIAAAGGTLKRATIGAGGALALDLIFGVVPMPAAVASGPFHYLAKGAIALGIGYAGKHMAKSAAVEQAAEGMLTVVLHEAGRAGIRQYFPNVDARMGEYMGGLGWVNASPIFEDTGEDGSLGDAYLNGYLSDDTALGGLLDQAGGQIFGDPETEIFG